MATESKAGLYQNAQGASYLPPTLVEIKEYCFTNKLPYDNDFC